jgi:molybdopterin/thiamine biosynthesis adenylyltransferase
MYERQIALIGKKNQKTLLNKTVTIIGLGSLGSNAANLLARSGVNLKLIDFDEIDETNLLSQSLYDFSDIGKKKAKISALKLMKINPLVKIKYYDALIDDSNLSLLDSDLVLDCTDNMATRLLINEYCYKNKIPLVHSAVIGYKGVIFNVISSPCLSCIYKSFSDSEKCEDFGVLNTSVSLISSLAVNEIIKILLKKDHETSLLRINLESNTLQKIKVKQDKNCSCCGIGKSINYKQFKVCNNKKVSTITPIKNIKLDFKKLKFNVINRTDNSITIKEDNIQLIIYSNGKILANTSFNKIRDLISLIYENGKSIPRKRKKKSRS